MRNEDFLIIALLTGFILLVIYIKTHSTNKPSSSNPKKSTEVDDSKTKVDIKNDGGK